MRVRVHSLIPTDKVRLAGTAARFCARNPIEVVIEREEMEAVKRAIEEMEDPRSRTVLQGFYLSQSPTNDAAISRAWGCSRQNVNAMKHKVLAVLRRRLAQKGFSR